LKWKSEIRVALSTQTSAPKYFINVSLRNKFRCPSFVRVQRVVMKG